MTEFLRFVSLLWCVAFVPDSEYELIQQFGSFHDDRKKYFLWQSCAVLQESYMMRRRCRRRRRRVATYKYSDFRGSNVYTPHRPHCESQFAAKLHGLHIQASNGMDDDAALRHMMELVGRLAHMNPAWQHSVDGGVASCLDILESFMLMYHNIRRCENVTQFVNQMMILFKLVYRDKRGEVLKTLVKRVLKFFDVNLSSRNASNVQSKDFSDIVQTMRSAFDAGDAVKTNPLFVKLRDLFSYLLTQGMLSSLGLSLSEEDFSKSSIRHYQSTYSGKVDLWWCVLDTTITILERVDDFRRSGRFSSFVHGKDKYEDWLNKTDELLALAPFTGNLSAHGTNSFQFYSDLCHQIELGDAIVAHTKMLTNSNNAYIAKKLHALKLLKASEITRKASQQERSAPYGVLVHGKSSVGKSSFTRMLFKYYGKLMNLNTGDEFLYARSPTDEFWSGFDTSKWCIRLDDIAFLDPVKAQMDGTLECVLNVINNVPFNPPQAALEEKGRTPVRAELVIATTNRADLHAAQYFSCPLAILRRFPFIVSVEVKPEYRQDPINDGTGTVASTPFLDPEKIGSFEGFPDLWEIKVQKIVPDCRAEGEPGKDYARLKTEHIFTDVNEFLRFFGERITQHKANQSRALGADKYMDELEVCTKCFYVGDKCECLKVQSRDIEVPGERTYFASVCAIFASFFCFGWLCAYVTKHSRSNYTRILCCDYTLRVLSFFGRYSWFRQFAGICLVPYMHGRVQLSLLGKWCESRDRKKIMLIVALLSTVSVAYASYSFFKGKERGVVSELNVQSNLNSEVDNRFEKESSNNVWYNPTVVLTSFDIPVSSRSLAGKSMEDLENVFQRNCVHLSVRFRPRGELRYIRRTISGVFVKGQYLLTHNHAFPIDTEDNYYDVTIVNGPFSGGITPSVQFKLFQTDILRSQDEDLAMVTVRSVAPYKDILKYWGDEAVGDISKGFYLRRNAHGVIERGIVRKAALTRNWHIEQLGISNDLYLAQLDEETAEGHCGSMLIHLTPRGPIINAFHLLGRGTTAGYLSVRVSSIVNLIKRSDEMLGEMKLCGGGEPMLNTGKSNFVLGDLHPKSVLRYCESGTAQIYGGLKGFRPAPKSKVRKTPQCAIVCDHFKYDIGHGPPVMNGWKPWRNNLVDMISPSILHSRSELHTVAKSFLEDIRSGLPDKWRTKLHVLTNKAIVNGLPSVKFIDSINRTSSMGHPWNTTKKNFLIPAVDDNYPDGVDFPSEIWDRVNVMECTYINGERNFPVFTEHLKDEAVSYAKIEQEKTRAFSGAPVDMVLLVRKYFLSFVRLLQMHSFVFEAAPGVNPTSCEWSAFYAYLTQHGLDRMIAGDYSKYDKKMIADLILEAFWIIIEMHREAGWSEESLRVMWGIATDIAFPLINFNGDLIEFFGTNPSGHPLTVIINSLVNSIYMRWMYLRLNPDRECHTFKENVALMTYGDDNIMGVSEETPWFNHTAVQEELANFNIVYTMADKESVSVPYIHIDDCEFLKRKWRYDETLGHFACPLNINSILKSLTVWLPSSSICAEEQFVNIVTSANMEFFFHGKGVFEEHHNFLCSLLDNPEHRPYLPSGGLSSWYDLVEKFTCCEPLLCGNFN
jgi:hypothetical protein